MVKIKCPHFFYKLLMRPFVILLQELRIWQSSEFAACMQTKEGLSQTLLWSSCHLHPFSSTQSPSAVLSDGAISTKSSQKVLFRSLSCAAVTQEWMPSYSPSLSPSHTKTHMHLPLQPLTLPICEITAEWQCLACIESPRAGCAGVSPYLPWDLCFSLWPANTM